MGIFNLDEPITREFLEDRGYSLDYTSGITRWAKPIDKLGEPDIWISILRLYNDQTGEGYWSCWVTEGGPSRWINKQLLNTVVTTQLDLINLEGIYE